MVWGWLKSTAKALDKNIAFGFSGKDLLVGAAVGGASFLPGGVFLAPLIGGAVGGTLSGISQGSFKAGLESGIMDAATSYGGGFAGRAIEKKILARSAKNILAAGGKKAAKKAAAAQVGKTIGKTRVADLFGQSAGGILGSRLGGAYENAANGSDASAAAKITAIPVRPAGADLSGRNFRDDRTATLDYNGGTVAQQPATTTGVTQPPAPDATPRAVPV
jgi:hypothetical protein